MKIMIADDEKWVRTTIKTLIPFKQLGFDLACEAANGIEALELIRQHQPDILLTDIMMPGLTGLDLIRELRKTAPQIRIIIISGYSDFEYAKTAMKYGVMDYLLKPVDEKELAGVLVRLAGEIREKRQQEETQEQEKSRYKKALPIVCEAFLNQIISPNAFTMEQMKSTLEKYGILFPHLLFTVAVFSPDGLQEEGTETRTEARTDSWKRIVARVLKHSLRAVTFSCHQNTTELIAILNHKDEPIVEAFQKAFLLCTRILEKRLETSVSAGISGSCRQLGRLGELYSQAVHGLQWRFWGKPGGLYRFNQDTAASQPLSQLTDDTLNKIALNLKLSNVQTALDYISNSIKGHSQAEPVNPSLVKEFYWQLIQSVLGMLNIQLQFIHQDTLLTGEHPYERIKKTIFLEQLGACTRDMMQRIYDFYHDKNPVNNTNLIENAKKIIEGNYAGDISLEQVARHVHLSAAYLSELFKKETGMSFIDYKTLVRIDRAKEFLGTTHMNVYEVSSRVGYTDPKYFSKLFKKVTGKTVFEYRKEVRGGR